MFAGLAKHSQRDGKHHTSFIIIERILTVEEVTAVRWDYSSPQRTLQVDLEDGTQRTATCDTFRQACAWMLMELCGEDA